MEGRNEKMKLIRLMTLIFIIIFSSSSIINAELTDDAYIAIEKSYLVILNTERVGGDVSVEIMMLKHASNLILKGGENNLNEAIILANKAKMLAFSIEESHRIEKIYDYIKLVVFLTVSFLAIIFIKKYGNTVYYSMWALIKGDWRIKRI